MTRWPIWIILTVGCFESIAPERPDAAIQADATPPGKFSTTRDADGTYSTIIDSTSMTDWTFGDFETGADSTSDAEWDLRFQRFHISTNGGVSGTGDVEVAPVADTAFADVTSPPASGWISDAADGDDANMDPDYAFEQGQGWYDYDPASHALAPKPLVWVVRTAGGDSVIKLEIVTYYDATGTAGWFKLRWRPL